MLNFIRDYAKSLDEMKNDLLKDMKVDEKDFYNVYTDLNLAENYINIICQYFIDKNYYI